MLFFPVGQPRPKWWKDLVGFIWVFSVQLRFFFTLTCLPKSSKIIIKNLTFLWVGSLSRNSPPPWCCYCEIVFVSPDRFFSIFQDKKRPSKHISEFWTFLFLSQKVLLKLWKVWSGLWISSWLESTQEHVVVVESVDPDRLFSENRLCFYFWPSMIPTEFFQKNGLSFSIIHHHYCVTTL